MIDDLKGPMILSTTLHLLLVMIAAIWALIEPDKKPEELVFELYAAPPPAPAVRQAEPKELYEPDDIELPTLDDIEVELPEPEVELTPESEPPPEPKRMTRADFIKEHGPIRKQRIPDKPRTQPRTDLSKQVRELEQNLSRLRDLQLPDSVISQISPQEQNELALYFASLKAAISRSVEQHPLSGQRLETKVQFTLHPNGRLSGPRVVTSSGDASFDRKVIAAFRRVGILGPPPGVHKNETLTLTVYQEDR